MSGERYRLVELRPDRGGAESVRPFVMSYEEAVESLDAEAYMHSITGWTVTRGEDLIVCSRGSAERVVQIRKFDPLSDFQTFEKGES